MTVRYALLALLVLSPHHAQALNKFTFRIGGEPETLDWSLAHTAIETHLMMNLMDGLVAIEPDLKVTPQLAESWKVSADHKTYTFKLRKGVVWSDGVPLVAQQFVDSWKRLLTRSTGASYAYFLYDLVGAEDFHKGKITDFTQVGVKALDDQTLQVKLSHPTPYWIYIPTFWVTFPMRKDLQEKYGKQWTQAGKLVTLGPLVLDRYEIDSKLVFKTNPHYWNKKTNVDEWTAQIIKDENTAVSLYEAGKVDLVNDLPTLALKKYADSPDLKDFPYLKTVYIGFAVNRPEVANPDFRRAIAMAIDKTQFAKILYGRQKAASSFVAPPLFATQKNLGLPFDITKAKEALVKSGYKTETKIDCVFPNWEKNLTVAQYLQAELKKNLGLNLQIQTFDFKTYRAQLESQSHSMFMASWGADYPDPDNFLSSFMSDSGNNRMKWKSPEYDALIRKAASITSQKERERLYVAAQEIFLKRDAVAIPIYYESNLILLKSRVNGLKLNPLNALDLREVTVK